MSHRRPTYHKPTFKVEQVDAETIGVLVAHPYRILRPVLETTLAERGAIVGEATTGRSMVAHSELLRPDVVVATDALEDGLIETFLPSLIDQGIAVLVLTEYADEDRLLTVLREGAAGAISTETSPSELADAVLSVAAGRAVVAPDVLTAMLREWRGGGSARGSAMRCHLTPREHGVMRAMVDGLSAKATGRLLGVAVKTVEAHKSRIFTKLGVRTQAEAVAAVISGRVAFAVDTAIDQEAWRVVHPGADAVVAPVEG